MIDNWEDGFETDGKYCSTLKFLDIPNVSVDRPCYFLSCFQFPVLIPRAYLLSLYIVRLVCVAATTPTQNTTKIYGDGDWSNGCIEEITKNRACTSSDRDIITPGAYLFNQAGGSNFINVTDRDFTGNSVSIKYDGSDVLYSSFPIAVTRGAYPRDKGTLLSGAVEVYDTKTYGTSKKYSKDACLSSICFYKYALSTRRKV